MTSWNSNSRRCDRWRCTVTVRSNCTGMRTNLHIFVADGFPRSTRNPTRFQLQPLFAVFISHNQHLLLLHKHTTYFKLFFLISFLRNNFFLIFLVICKSKTKIEQVFSATGLICNTHTSSILCIKSVSKRALQL
jgi:hypothetical protein